MEALLPFELNLFLAALAGATAYYFVRPDRKDSTRAAATIVTGTGTSFFLTPWLCESIEMETFRAEMGIAFGVGLLGQIICRTVIVSAESEGAKGVWAIVWRAGKRAFGIPDSQEKKDLQRDDDGK